MSFHMYLNFSYVFEFTKQVEEKDNMQGLPSILCLFHSKLYVTKITLNSCFWHAKLKILP